MFEREVVRDVHNWADVHYLVPSLPCLKRCQTVTYPIFHAQSFCCESTLVEVRESREMRPNMDKAMAAEAIMKPLESCIANGRRVSPEELKVQNVVQK